MGFLAEGYTEIVKAIEKGLSGNTVECKKFVEQYIQKYPKGDFTKAFKDLTNPEYLPKLHLQKIEKNKMFSVNLDIIGKPEYPNDISGRLFTGDVVVINCEETNTKMGLYKHWNRLGIKTYSVSRVKALCYTNRGKNANIIARYVPECVLIEI